MGAVAAGATGAVAGAELLDLLHGGGPSPAEVSGTSGAVGGLSATGAAGSVGAVGPAGGVAAVTVGAASVGATGGKPGVIGVAVAPCNYSHKAWAKAPAPPGGGAPGSGAPPPPPVLVGGWASPSTASAVHSKTSMADLNLQGRLEETLEAKQLRRQQNSLEQNSLTKPARRGRYY